ncbi:MAG TPA: HAMP domain-containing sensor histidine kinase [Stellaceae bacterium]|nr:HAMP domain-containing sensor histidine kinase [Stellaceae bacterium]
MPVASLILSQPSPATAKAPPQAAKLLAGGEHAIAVELADLLYDSPWPVATNLVVTLATIGVLSFAFQSLIFLGWGISIAGICVVRILLWRLYHRHRLQADFEPQAWIRRFTYFAAATGCQWGSLATAVALLSSANADLFVPIIIAGLAGGIASDYTPHVPVVDAFIWPVVLPLIIVTFAVGDAPHIALSLLYFVFVVNLSLMARRSFRTLVHKLREKAEKEQLVTRLFEANRRAETALRAKSEFLANMSHELRTPLNAVIGFSEIISDEILGPIGNRKYLEYAHDLHASGQHLLQLINDILDLTKIGAGKLDLVEETVDISELIGACVRMMAHRAKSQGLTLSQSVAPDVDSLRGDSRRLRQVMLNLLSNSVKFTPPGGSVAVRCWIEAGRLVVEVRDTGVGIAEDDLPRALEPFGQVDNAFNRHGGGTGLGLPLTKRLVELHDGTFEIISRAGAGSAVKLTFPPSRTVKTPPRIQPERDALTAA